MHGRHCRDASSPVKRAQSCFFYYCSYGHGQGNLAGTKEEAAARGRQRKKPVIIIPASGEPGRIPSSGGRWIRQSCQQPRSFQATRKVGRHHPSPYLRLSGGAAPPGAARVRRLSRGEDTLTHWQRDTFRIRSRTNLPQKETLVRHRAWPKEGMKKKRKKKKEKENTNKGGHDNESVRPSLIFVGTGLAPKSQRPWDPAMPAVIKPDPGLQSGINGDKTCSSPSSLLVALEPARFHLARPPPLLHPTLIDQFQGPCPLRCGQQ